MSQQLNTQAELVVRGWRGGQWLLAVSLVLALGLAAGRAFGGQVPTWVLLWALSGLLGTISVGVAWPQTGVFARPVLGFRTSAPLLALTFDDGPHPVNTPQILDLLDRYGHRATFFVIGAKAEQQQDLLAEIVRRGHELGNHSCHHRPWTPALPAAVLLQELQSASHLLKSVAGHVPRWFRPPMGLVSPPVALAAERAGLDLVTWTATARDGVASAQSHSGFARLLRSLRPGSILVLHDGVPGRSGRPHAVLAILPQLLSKMQERGLRSVTLSELIPSQQR